jgi:hypothetical protein
MQTLDVPLIVCGSQTADQPLVVADLRPDLA